MSYSKASIVTDGDTLVNTVTTLGEMQHIASRLSKAITHLSDIVADKLSPGPEKIKF